MQVVRLDIEYEGSRFSGWAAQPGQRTCEGVLVHALGVILRVPVDLHVAGRTDSGVHATGQVASFVCDAHLDARRLTKSLAGILPPDLAVRKVGVCAADFDARRSAIGRTYEYRVLVGARSPLRRGRVLHCASPLDRGAIDAAASACVGQHDFTAFTPSKTEHASLSRRVRRCYWEARDDELVLTVEADAFLHNMVRILVGTMLEIGRGTRPAAQMMQLLAGAPRSASGQTAPAHPLTLVGVRYPETTRDAPILGRAE
jgi:tRNA pseudouridine38-40 synthase